MVKKKLTKAIALASLLFTSSSFLSGCMDPSIGSSIVTGTVAGTAAGVVTRANPFEIAKLAKKNYFEFKMGSVNRVVDVKEGEDYLEFGYAYRLNYTKGETVPFRVIVKAKPVGAPEDKYEVIFDEDLYLQNGVQGGVLDVDVPKKLRSTKTLDVVFIITPKAEGFENKEIVYKDTVTAGAAKYVISK